MGTLATLAQGTGVVQGGALAVAAQMFGGAQALTQYLNPALVAAELGQPEGTPIQVVITGYQYSGLLGSYTASQAAAYLNGAWQDGQITDPATGEVLQAWPGQGAVAWGDDSSATLTVRYLKGQPWLAYLLVGLALAVVAVALYEILSGAGWNISKLNPTSSTGLGGTDVFGLPLWVWLAGGVALVALPWAVGQVSRYERADVSLLREERQARALRR